MTKDELRKHFDLKPCPNYPHEFNFLSMTGEWVWAEDCWAQIVGQRMQTLHFSFHTIKSVEGTVAYSLVVWKLKIIWGFLK